MQPRIVIRFERNVEFLGSYFFLGLYFANDIYFGYIFILYIKLIGLPFYKNPIDLIGFYFQDIFRKNTYLFVKRTIDPIPRPYFNPFLLGWGIYVRRLFGFEAAPCLICLVVEILDIRFCINKSPETEPEQTYQIRLHPRRRCWFSLPGPDFWMIESDSFVPKNKSNESNSMMIMACLWIQPKRFKPLNNILWNCIVIPHFQHLVYNLWPTCPSIARTWGMNWEPCQAWKPWLLTDF